MKKIIGALLLFAALTVTSNLFGQVDYTTDPHLTTEVRTFLKGLNAGGTAVESLPFADARKVLVDVQASVKVNLSGIDVSEKTITADGYTIK